MAKETPADAARAGTKLPKLPGAAKVTKRPLMHPAIPSPYRGRETQKVVYVSSKTPFMSAFKRVKGLLKQVDKRAMQSELHHARRRRHHPLPDAHAGASPAAAAEQVLVKATGKAIDKALNLALFLQTQADLKIEIRTSSTTAIDDIEAGEEAVEGSEGEELPESRLRGVSILEIAVSLK